ncbi:MAG: hypothetical protein SWK76_11230 [Actinomycetota bacterium]|nr:hypothetical protein [Actinomycetota bacterium]
MDPKMMQKMMIEGMRAGMRASFDAMNAMQEQVEKMWRMLLEQSGDMQKEGEKALAEWLENMRKGREEFRRNMEDGVRKMEEMVVQD